MTNSQRCKTYRNNHPEYFKTYSKNRRKTDIQWKLRSNLRHKIYMTITGKISTGEQELGCTTEEFKKYISTKFKKGMSWNNFGKMWHLDHVKPLDRFNLKIKKQILEAFNYTNYQPLFIKENIMKNNYYNTKVEKK